MIAGSSLFFPMIHIKYIVYVSLILRQSEPTEFMRFFHPKLGIFVYRHKGSGIIIDNIFKPVRRIASTFAKPVSKKALQSGISHAGDKLGKKAAEKSGDFIMKKLAGKFNRPSKSSKPSSQSESTDVILNRLKSGSGMRRKIV